MLDQRPLLSDHLLEALSHLNHVREIIRRSSLERHREAIVHEVIEAEKAVARVIGLIAGQA